MRSDLPSLQAAGAQRDRSWCQTRHGSLTIDKTLLKGLAVLEVLVTPQGRPRTIEELSREVKLSRSSVHRTLQTLAHAHYVRKDEATGRYHPTMKLFEMGARQLAAFDVRNLALPFMRALAQESGETVHLSILEGITVVYIDKIDSPQPVRSYTAIGGRAPAYAVATGKAMLAHQPVGYLERYAGELRRHTPATIASVTALKRELERVRTLGYALNRGKWRETVGGLAVGIFDGLDRVVAALGISGPLERLEKGRFAALAPAVREYAGEISKAMGYSKPPLGGDGGRPVPRAAAAAAALHGIDEESSGRQHDRRSLTPMPGRHSGSV